MKQNFTLYVYKFDRRTKSGERSYITRVITDRTEAEMAQMVDEMVELFPDTEYRMEFFPSTVTVKNLMTGKDVEIDRDTPWCCNPASETYWSM